MAARRDAHDVLALLALSDEPGASETPGNAAAVLPSGVPEACADAADVLGLLAEPGTAQPQRRRRKRRLEAVAEERDGEVNDAAAVLDLLQPRKTRRPFLRWYRRRKDTGLKRKAALTRSLRYNQSGRACTADDLITRASFHAGQWLKRLAGMDCACTTACSFLH